MTEQHRKNRRGTALMRFAVGVCCACAPLATTVLAYGEPNARTVYDYRIAAGIAVAALLVATTALVFLYVIRGRYAQRIEHTLYRDALTGLYNKAGFEAFAQKTLDAHPEENWAVVDFDVNRFETLNSLFGYEAGDELLRHIAETLMAHCQPDEICGRLINDRFAALWRCGEPGQLEERIGWMDEWLRPLYSGMSLFFSYGVARAEGSSLAVTVLLDRALIAKRTIKGRHDQYVAYYDGELHRRMVEESELISRIPRAMDNEEFVVYYQPQYDLASRRMVSAEALVRWSTTDGGIIPPGRFIGLCERGGLITRLDFYVLDQVCRMQHRLLEEGIEPLTVAVNFSRAHFDDDNFPELMRDFVEARKVPPRLIQVEVTEGSVTSAALRIGGIFERLREMGFSVAIDDFGSGDSSLGMLKDVRADVIKLDRSFIVDGGVTGRGQFILESIFYALARMDVISLSEGVETFEQLSFLSRCGCELVQGFLFARPMPERDFDAMVREHSGHVRRTQHPLEDRREYLAYGGTFGMFEVQKLLRASAQYFSMIISANLTTNRYFMMEYEHFTTRKAAEEGNFDELIEVGASTMHPDWREAFVEHFSREKLLAAWERGEREVSCTVLQMGDDGQYHWIVTTAVFVENPFVKDVMEITFARPADNREVPTAQDSQTLTV